MDLTQTGDTTGSSTTLVSPAPSTTIAPTSFTHIPPSTAPAVDPSLIANYEQRVRSLMSEKDRTKADYERAVAERLELQRQKDDLERLHQSTVSASTKSIQEALDRAKEYEAHLTKERARTAKLTKLLAHPELAAYAAFIPETDNETQLEEAIKALKETRERDIQAALQQQQATLQQQVRPTAPDPRSVLSPNNTFIPPAQPARPAQASTVSSAEALDQKLKLAAQEAFEKKDSSIWERALQEAALAAQAQYNQQ